MNGAPICPKPFSPWAAASSAPGCFKIIYPRAVSPEQWEDRLRRKIDLERELTRWGYIATAYAHFAPPGKAMPAAARRDYFDLCRTALVNGPDMAMKTVKLGRISQARARRVVDHIRRTHRWA